MPLWQISSKNRFLKSKYDSSVGPIRSATGNYFDKEKTKKIGNHFHDYQFCEVPSIPKSRENRSGSFFPNNSVGTIRSSTGNYFDKEKTKKIGNHFHDYQFLRSRPDSKSRENWSGSFFPTILLGLSAQPQEIIFMKEKAKKLVTIFMITNFCEVPSRFELEWELLQSSA
jgi:hypothetical protein